ncbi:Hypothetical_protein [Hexamita inflata]|uniref:Hypothetical_protein n=1 Tax=Hexamita inflata TaxID=28002 RepID=A0AA86PGW5_9EUKA|nr:Hypothetical protein HINF_LOCUS26053 [Hexamita inflata]
MGDSENTWSHSVLVFNRACVCMQQAKAYFMGRSYFTPLRSITSNTFFFVPSSKIIVLDMNANRVIENTPILNLVTILRITRFNSTMPGLNRNKNLEMERRIKNMLYVRNQ